MAVNVNAEMINYLSALQQVAALVRQMNAKITQLNDLYTAANVSANLTDTIVQSNSTTQHLTAANCVTYQSNLQTVQASMTTAILQNMSQCAGNAV